MKTSFLDRIFPSGIAQYSAGYAFAHPWKIVGHLKRELKWAWQRVFRGYDDRISWSIDFYLNSNLPKWIRQLKENQHGVPSVCFEEKDWNEDESKYDENAEERAKEKWDNILDNIAEGFEAKQQIDDESLWVGNSGYAELNKKFEKGFDLFRQYYDNLWD